MTSIRGVLFDIDGVLVTSWRPIDGAADPQPDHIIDSIADLPDLLSGL